MGNSNEKKAKTLGMPHGTATNRLRKKILFSLLVKYGENFCFKCGAEIEKIDEFSIEHKQVWEGEENGFELFFDLDNIAFSHLSCNVKAARRPRDGQVTLTHGESYAYDKHGCRCELCK